MKLKNILHVGVCFWTVLQCLMSSSLLAQTPGQWTWMNGNNTVNSPGVFGTQGIASPANRPAAVYASCEWTDNNGNFWLFGGLNPSFAMYSSLWKFDPDPTSPTYNQWTWMKGPSATNQVGVYGTKGVPSAANTPGARGLGVVTWVDAAGDLWLFGGGGWDGTSFGEFNDLWKYNIATNQWTWMHGPSTPNSLGSYGTKGVPLASNLPRSRGETSCSWTDNFGNLWFYGGGSSINYLGDMWRYNIATNIWTWMHGSNTFNLPSVYGAQGVAAAANTPGARWTYCSWSDLAGNFWLFGGDHNGTFRNDLWKYDPDPASPTYNQWTWVKGPSTGDQPGVYGTKCVPSAANFPHPRFENRARVRDECGNFWQMGGLRYNDLWHYNLATNQWTWVSGDQTNNPPTVYGTLGVSAPANKPGGRMTNVAWMDNLGYIWVFGGQGTSTSNMYNDLFRFVPDPACIPPCNILNAAVSSTPVLCNSECNGTATVNASSGSTPYTYSWDPSAAAQTTQTATGLCFGTYTVTVSDAVGTTTTQTVSITQPAPLTSTITPANASCNSLCNGNATLAVSGGSPGYTYTWNTSPAQTTANATGLCSNSYTATITDNNGCPDTQVITITEPADITTAATATTTTCAESNGSAQATASGGTGTLSYNWLPSGGNTSAANNLASGTYSVIVTDGNGCTKTQTVTVAPSIGATANAASNVTIAQGDTATLTASGGGSYLWNTGSTDSVIVLSPTVTTEYCVTVTDANNCTASACATVALEPVICLDLYLPNAFSPNGDGENDDLCLQAGIEFCVKELKIIIYSRWGEKVFESTDPKFCWDGTYQSQLMNSAVFVFYLEANMIEGKIVTKKGNVSLLR